MAQAQTKKQKQANALRRQRGNPQARPSTQLPRRQRPVVVRTPARIPRGLDPKHHFNAFGVQKPQALAFSIGPATHVSGYRAKTFEVESNEDYMLVFNPCSGANQLVAWSRGTSTGVWSALDNSSIASIGFSTTPSGSAPESIMASRGSIRIRNKSIAGNVGGVVRSLRLSTRLPFTTADPTDTELDVLRTQILGHARTHTYSASTLTETHQFDCIPTSQNDYTKWQNVTSQMSAWLAHQDGGTFGLSTNCFLLEGMTNSQFYEITFAASYYARYSYSGVLANMASHPPTTSIAHTNIIRDAAEAVGSAGYNIAKQVGSYGLQVGSSAAVGYLQNLMRAGFSAGAPAAMGALRGPAQLALEDGAMLAL